MKQNRALRAHERILDAAAHEFVRHGYAHTTTQAVAERSGMTKGGLYAHFTSKSELAQAFHDHASILWNDLERTAASAGPDAHAQLSVLPGALAEQLQRDQRLQAALRLDDERELSGSPGLLVQIRSRLSALAGAAQADRALADDCTPDLVAHILLALTLSTSRLPGSDAEVERQMEQMWAWLWSALRGGDEA